MHRTYLALALALTIISSAAAASMGGLGAQATRPQAPIAYDDGSADLWRDMGPVILLNNGTHASFEIVSAGQAPGGGDGIYVSRYLTAYLDTDGNFSTGVKLPSINYGADVGMTYSVVDDGSTSERFNVWAILPNGSRASIATNYTAHNNASDLSITLPTSGIGAAGSALQVLLMYYSTMTDDTMPDARNTSIPHIPLAAADNDSKWEGVEPVITDWDGLSSNMSPTANATDLYLGISGDILCIRVYSEGYDPGVVGGSDFGYVTLFLSLDLDGDRSPDISFSLNRYFRSTSAYVGIYNISSGDWVSGDVVSDYSGVSDYVEFDINMSEAGLDLGGDLGVMGTRYRVVTLDYVGSNYLYTTKFIMWPDGRVKALVPAMALLRSFRGRMEVALGQYRVVTESSDQGGGNMASFTTYGTSPSYATISPPGSGGNLTPYLTIHYRSPGSVKWPVEVTYETPPNTVRATAYYINIENSSYSRFSEQFFDPGEGRLVVNVSEDEYMRPEGEVTVVIAYVIHEPVTTSTTTTATSTTTTTSTTSPPTPTTTTSTTAVATTTTPASTTTTAQAWTTTTQTTETSGSAATTSTQVTQPTTTASPETSTITPGETGGAGGNEPSPAGGEGVILLAGVAAAASLIASVFVIKRRGQ